MRINPLLAVAVAAFASAALAMGLPARVNASVPPYQLTVSETASAMTFGQAAPNFSASLVPPAGDPALGAAPYYISIDGVNYGGNVSYQGPPYLLTLRGGAVPLAAGVHSVTASYVSPNYGLLTSAPITLTVLKATPSGFECYFAGASLSVLPGTALSVVVSPSGLAGGTFSVTYTGSQTFTSPGSPLDANNQFVSVAPPAPGVYQARCNFSGNADYSATTASLNSRQLTVTAGHAVGGISLYTDPAPLVFNALTTWRVIVTGQPGLPAPGGYVSLQIERSFTKILQLGADGTLTFSATTPGFAATDQIQVSYSGDAVYAAKIAYFPTSTRPIPGGATSKPGAGSTSGNALPAAGAVSPTPSSEASSSPSPTSLPSLVPALGKTLAVTTDRVRSAWYVGAGIGLLALLAAGAGVIAYRRRRRTQQLSRD